MNIDVSDRRFVCRAYREKRLCGGLDHEAYTEALTAYRQRYPGSDHGEAVRTVSWILGHEALADLIGPVLETTTH